MSILPLRAPGLFRKIMVGELDYYSPLTIGFGIASKVQKRQHELFSAQHPDVTDPTDEQIEHFLNKEGGSEEMLGILAEYLLLPGEHGIPAKDIVDHIDTDTVVELMDFFTQSAAGKIKTFKDYKPTSLDTNDPVPVESTTKSISPKNTSKSSTPTSPRKGDRGK